MVRPLRSDVFTSEESAIVHVVQRCVRRTRLAGLDPLTGRDYSFRREWIRARLEALASVFGIDVLTYAVLSNHVHAILRNRPDVVAQWDDREVALRWLKVFPGRRIDEQLGEPTEADVEKLITDEERLAEVRRRLSDISWFMRALSEPIARRANREDGCTGRFWEGRFKAQRITDEAGLLACAMYVDLNPVRAALAESPEQSPYTSAYDRILAQQGQQIDSAAFDLNCLTTAEAAEEIRGRPPAARRGRSRAKSLRRVSRDAWLAPLELDAEIAGSDPQVHRGGVRASDKGFLNLPLDDYLCLLHWTAQQREPGSVAELPESLRGLVGRLGIAPTMWRDLVWNFQRYFGASCCAGSPSTMITHATSRGRKWARGHRKAAACFASQS
jgi:REP element-mobilizing transposase RayT